MKKSLLIKPFLTKSYPAASYGSGIYIYDTEGKRYIDGSSGAVTASIGHGIPEIIRKMEEQSKKISFVYRSQFTNSPAELLAHKINEAVNSEENYWSFFVNSGSEATETAMKIAIQHFQEQGLFQKNKIISRWMSYHGITLGSLSLSGHKLRREKFVTLLDDGPNAEAPYCYRCSFHMEYPECNMMCAVDIERAIKRAGNDNVAAFIAEPIIGAAGGVIVPPPGYYEQVQEICKKNNVLFIADEVMTGFGRTGKMFALEHWTSEADIIVTGKGLSAGYAPIGAALCKESVLQPVLNGSKSIMSGHTFSANPQSAAAALAVLEYMNQYKLIEKASLQGKYLFRKLKKLKQSTPVIGEVRGKGLLAGIEIVCNPVSKKPFPRKAAVTERVINKAQQKGLLIYPATAGERGYEGDAVIIAPPLIVTRKEIDEMMTILQDVFQELLQELCKEGHHFVS
ncbi:aspartate aminotransferase family protein [Bacillus sp. FJAT-44742]|uniref:aspartate aminotransferase family protein n=1 Tax=Bacillus sp. FJAT-44742 TaxID=2014005 RepID=UPI000C2491B6|nr:aspartate aminotransferase family protein [Bacillus sp. FJAT-44742]